MAPRKSYPMSMAGLEAYNGSAGIGRIINKRTPDEQAFADGELQQHGLNIVYGAASIAVLSSLLTMWTVPTDAATQTAVAAGEGMYAPATFSRIKNVIAIGVGVVAGKLVYDMDGMENAGSAILGATAGLALAELIASFIPARDGDPVMPEFQAGGAPYVTTQMHGVRYN